MIQKKYRPLQIKSVNVEDRTFTGIAATWDVDLDGERFEKGAFKRGLNTWKASAGDWVIQLIDSHRYGSTRDAIGKLLEAEETSDGLRAKFDVVDSPDGHEFWSRIKQGIIKTLSVGFEVSGDTGEEKHLVNGKEKKIRVFKRAKLKEVSLVLWPAQPGALIDPVKMLVKAAAERQITPEERAELDTVRTEIDRLLETEEDEPDAEPIEEAAQEEDAPAEETVTPGAPPELEPIEKELADIVAMKEIAVGEQDYYAAALLRDQERGLRSRLERKQKELAQGSPAPLWTPEDPKRLKAEALVASLRATVSGF